MTFLFPGWLVLAGTAALAVVALHLLNRQRVRERPFPTARFVPDASVRSVSRTLQPTDVALLLLRVATVLLVGLALARPAGTPPRRTATIVLADRSPATDSAAVDRAVARMVSPPDTVIEMKGLTAGIISARKAAMHLSAGADSVALIVVSAVPAGLWDAATASIRASWPGRILVVPVTAAPIRFPLVTTDAPVDGVVRAALARLGRRGAGETVHLRWPPPGQPSDTATGVYAAGAAMIGRVPRWPVSVEGARAIAWFVDGTPAVVEKPLATGCERVSGFRLDEGDGLLRAAGLRVIERLIAPCGAGWTPDLYGAADSTRVALLAGSGGAASVRALGPDRTRPIMLLPLLLALVLLGGERALRRRIP